MATVTELLKEEPRQIVGQSLRRKEDPRLLTGLGKFVDDLKLPGMLHTPRFSVAPMPTQES